MTAESTQAILINELAAENQAHLEKVAHNLSKAAKAAEQNRDVPLNHFFLTLLAICLFVIAGCVPMTSPASPTQASTVEATVAPFARVGKILSAEELTTWNTFAEEYLQSGDTSWIFQRIEGFAFLLESQIDGETHGGVFYPGFDDLVQYGNRPYDRSGHLTLHAQYYYDLYVDLLRVLNLTEQQMLDIRNSSGLDGFREVIKQKLAEQQLLSEDELDRNATWYAYNLAFHFSSLDLNRSRENILSTIAELE